MRLIDADALKTSFDLPEEYDEFAYHVSLPIIKATIDDAPTVDAVEVVRCKDCKLYEPNKFPIRSGHPCSRVGLEPNDFCSWVEPLWEDEVEDGLHE